MRAHTRYSAVKPGLLVGLEVSLLMLAGAGLAPGGNCKPGQTVSRAYAEGRDLFVKLWEPGARSDAGGDGLGPLYNERSCVGCHHLGGTGGAGGNDKNVTLLCAQPGTRSTTRDSGLFQGELEELHPGLRNRQAVVLHANAVCPDDAVRLAEMVRYSAVQTRDDLISLSTSSRNTPALFGLGLVDRISEATLVKAEAQTFAAFPEISGRVSRLRDGRIGRFGWKGQTASLGEFVLNACSNEMGLEVEGRHQVSLASAADFDPKALKLDLNDEQTTNLANFVEQLPRPILLRSAPVQKVNRGRLVFASIGCAACHRPSLGSVEYVYSDLLLHDMGDRFRDFGGYGSTGGIRDLAASETTEEPTGEAVATEWRTPPLWGVADSAPYLHDGRAETLHVAIQLHGGEAAKTAERYRRMSRVDQQALLAFLHSLRAPNAESKAVRRR